MSKKRYLIITGIVAAAAAAVVSILLYTMPANHQPVIKNLVYKPEKVVPWGTCQIVCNATDPDGDQLSYTWSVSAGNITGTGASVDWIAPLSAGSYNVTVTVTDGRGAKVMRYIVITVKANRAPTINSLVADADWTTPLGSLRVTCNATDPDHDQLSYEWSGDGGDISGAGATVNWTAPDAVGAYNVTVVVRDGYGGQDTSKILLNVVLGTPPTIENLIVTGNGNPYLKEDGVAGCDYEVYQTKKYDVDCIASSASGGLSYEWSCTNGVISGEGSRITWTAPGTPSGTSIKVTVRVTVSDVSGNSVTKDIVFYVSYCTCPF